MNDPGGTAAPPGFGGRSVLLINARARSGSRAVSAVTDALRLHGMELDRVVRVKRPSRLREAVDAIVDGGVGRLIVGGGDGTLGTVAARLAASPVALGVIPMGTANDFARTLGIPNNLARAAAIAAGSHVLQLDMASANGEPFLNVASIGLSVATTARLSHGMKRWLGPAAYAFAGALAIARHLTFHARIDSAGGSVERRVHQIIVGNGRFYGGGVLVARGSTLDDGVLAVYTLGAEGRFKLLRTLALLRLGVPLDRPGDVFVQAPEVFVKTRPERLPVNLDGEIRTRTPVRFAVVPGALRVLTPGPPGSG